MTRPFLFLLLALIISSCDWRNILVTGQITDELSGEPISDAEVVVLCWYWSNIDDASYVQQTVRTDKNGNYRANFKKGHDVDVASISTGFNPTRGYSQLKGNKAWVDLKLARIANNPSLVSCLIIDECGMDDSYTGPFSGSE
jgi:hypothetical protein